MSPSLSGEGLEVIKEEGSPPSEAAGGTSFSDEISNAFKKRKETAEIGGREAAAISPAPSSSGSLSDEIANAVRRREERKPTTESPKSPPVPASGGSSLEDQLAAAIKKRSTSPPQESPVASSGGATGGGSLEDQLAAAIKKRSSSPPVAIKEKEQINENKEEEGKREEALGSLGNIQTELLSMLTSFGESGESKTLGTDKEKLIQDEEPKTTGKYEMCIVFTAIF